MATGILKMQQ
jgi:hypothetical protein